jgi:soluble lytic murein transglycosylase-like protein
LRPWLWTINAEGVGHFFATRSQAVAAVRDLWGRGVRSIDAGCLQVNLMYHPKAFASLEDAFDPTANAGYAARFLNSLHAEGRAWPHAVAAYHSETPELGEAYRALVMARWQASAVPASPPGRSSYRDVGGGIAVYGAFAPVSRAYGAFSAAAVGRQGEVRAP